jgi:predicted alpha/beta-hydrolase family hydrolase
MTSEALSVYLPGRTVESVGAVLARPDAAERASAILLAHGAGVDMTHPWMSTIAAALVARGFEVLRFRYPYMERAQREKKPIPPDRAPLLEDAHAAALEELKRRCPGKRWLLAGKSLGGRMATHIAAKGADCAGLVLFGYPLHPPREPAKERSEHFAALAQPALFLQGTRDEFGTPDELRNALKRYGGTATLSIVEGGDHSFDLPAAAKRSIDDVLAELASRVDEWERATWPE